MTGKKLILPDAETVSMSSQAASLLIGCGCPEAALLYIYILKNKGTIAPDANTVLNLSENKLNFAISVLYRIGLIKSESTEHEAALNPNPTETIRPYGEQSSFNTPDSDIRQTPAAVRRPVPADELPDYSIADIKREIANGAQFSMLVAEVQKALGKILSSDDLIKLFGIYDCLRLPPEVILQLVTFCIEENRLKYGEYKLPTMRYIEKAAYTWEREELFSLEKAEEYIKKLTVRREKTSRFCSVLQIRGRELTPTERKYIDSWINMGFESDAAAIAFDRTVTQTGKLAWKYMDSIMKNWHGKNLHKASEIEKQDSRSNQNIFQTPKTNGSGAPTAADIDRMLKTLEKIKEG